MKLSGRIQELFSRVSFYKQRSFLTEGYLFVELIDEKIDVLFRDEDEFCPVVMLDGLWIGRSKQASKYLDLFNTGNTYPDINFMVCDNNKYNNGRIVLHNFQNDKLVIINTFTWVCIEKEYEKGIRFTCDEEFVYLRTDYEQRIYCMDYDFNVLWQWYTDKEHYGSFENRPQIYGGLLIINHAYDTIALNKHTGKEVWKYTFEDIPTSNILMQGKIYAVCKAVLYVINPENGKVELERDTRYPVNWGSKNKNRNRIGVFPVGEYLYAVADIGDERYPGNLRIYNKDASEVLDAVYPPDYYLNASYTIQPTIHGNKIYQTVRNGYAYSTSGIMILEISEDKNASIKVAPRPPVTMLAHPSLNETHKLQIFLSADNLDDAMRYGDLYVQELLYATSYYSMYNTRKNALDTKHNGYVELVMDTTSYNDPDADEYLNSLESRIQKSIKNGLCTAGDKQTPIQFSLIKQPKAEWDLSGEILDWPAIRDRETPLS